MYRIAAFLIPLLCTGTALAQSSDVKSAATPAVSAPVAYVYVSKTNPNYVDVLAASSSGALTYIGDVSTPAPLTHQSTSTPSTINWSCSHQVGGTR